jgi:hypothetical protein
MPLPQGFSSAILRPYAGSLGPQARERKLGSVTAFSCACNPNETALTQGRRTQCCAAG